MRTQASGLVSLSAEEALRLLQTHPVHVGRLGVTDPDGQPLIMPVNYRLDADAVIVRTDPGSLVARLAVGQRVAFEVDEVNAGWREGWSVLIQGVAQQVTSEQELMRLRQLPLHPWAPGERVMYLRIPVDVISARRIM